jgi:HSP20 family protein
MVDLNIRRGGDMLDPIRRFLEGDWQGQSIRVEEFVDGQTRVVRAELPDVDPDRDIEVSVSNGVLTIRAERSEKTERKGKDGYRSEFRYGSFTRSFPLSSNVRQEDVRATYKDGVLEVRTPMPAETPTAPGKVHISRDQ